MQNILAIDTASQYCSVALYAHGDIVEQKQQSSRSHAQHILNMIDAVLIHKKTSLNALDAIVVNTGPGSFTGLRIGLSVAQGLAYTHDISVAAVNSLQALSMQVNTDYDVILPLIDARMQEVYFGLYKRQDGLVTSIIKPLVMHPEKCLDLIKDSLSNHEVYCLGNALGQYPQLQQKLKDIGVNVYIGDEMTCATATDLLKFYISQYVQRQVADQVLQDAKFLAPQYVRNQVTS